MTNTFDCIISALIQAQKRTPSQDEVDNAILDLIHVAENGQNTHEANEKLSDKIGLLMNEQFEFGVRRGIQLVMQAVCMHDLSI